MVRFGSDLRAAAEPLDGPFCSAVAAACAAAGVAAVVGVVRAGARRPGVQHRGGVLRRRVTGGRVPEAAPVRRVRPARVRPGGAGFRRGASRRSAACPVGLQICYDIRFPELTRALAVGGASLVTVSAAWQAGLFKEEHWVTLLRARAIENTVWVAAVGQVPDPDDEADPRADRAWAGPC